MRISNGVQQLAAWLAVFGFLSAAFWWLWGHVEAVPGLGWAERILLATASGAVLVLVLGVGVASLAAWRYFRPLKLPEQDLDKIRDDLRVVKDDIIGMKERLRVHGESIQLSHAALTDLMKLRLNELDK
jgi:hypothetical protein